MPFLFEKLDVYQKSLKFAEEVSKSSDTFPKGTYYLIDQLSRAALSISANIAEGNGRWHKNDKKQFFLIARGSAQECVPILEICFRKKLIDNNLHQQFRASLENICKMLSGLLKSLEEVSNAEKAMTKG
jgi:four helix bundle protein